MSNEKMVPLVVRYSYDTDTPVWLFNTLQEAVDELKKQYEEEIRIETEENGNVLDKDMEVEIDPDGTYAKIVMLRDISKHYPAYSDVTEWFIGEVRN